MTLCMTGRTCARSMFAGNTFKSTRSSMSLEGEGGREEGREGGREGRRERGGGG